MTRSLILAAALAAPVPALALTPEELWASWQEMAAAFGGTIEAMTTSEADGALRLSAFRAGPAGGPLEAANADAPVQEIILRPNADGTVAIDLGPIGGVIPGDFGSPSIQVEPVEPTILAREGEGGITCELSAASLRAYTLPPVDGVPGDEFSSEMLAPVLAFPCGVPADGRYEVSLGVEGFAYVTATAPDAFMASSQASRVEGPMSLVLGLTPPPLAQLQAMDSPQGVLAALDAGMAFDLVFENGGLEQSDWADGLFAFQSTVSTSPGSAEMALDRSGFVMTGAYEEGGEGTFSSPALPVGTVEYGFGPMDTEIRVPFGPEPGEVRYRIALEGVTVGEPLWAMVDPEGALPRDPARLVIDVGGTMAVDLPAIIAVTQGPVATPPYPDIQSLEIRELDVSVAGVSVGGEGSFTFETVDGLPSPIGTATIRLGGIDRLLDTVVEMGWATPEDARNARLGLAAMFRAGDGPDQRVTVIEAREGGAIFVNGVQMR